MKITDKVKCPPDRGSIGYIGTIVEIGRKDINYYGKEFTWIGVSNGHHVTWWSSTRLTLI